MERFGQDRLRGGAMMNCRLWTVVCHDAKRRKFVAVLIVAKNYIGAKKKAKTLFPTNVTFPFVFQGEQVPFCQDNSRYFISSEILMSFGGR